MTRRMLAALIYLLAVAGISGGVWWFALVSDLSDLAERGEADLSLAADRLVGQLQRFRELSVLLSDHPDLTALLAGRGNAKTAVSLIQTAADQTGSLDMLVVSASGQILAASENAAAVDRSAPFMIQAIDGGALGVEHGMDPETGIRSFSFAAPVFSAAGPVSGAVIVRADIGAVEAEWRGEPMMVAFVDDFGVVFVTNRSEILYRLWDGFDADAQPYPASLVQPFPEHRVLTIAGQEIWQLDAGRYIPRRAIHLSRPLPIVGLTGEALVDVAPALTLATYQALVVLALGLVLGAFILTLADRRRALAVRLSLEAAANAALEMRVSQRTAELSATNRALRREIDERIAAEDALKKAQDDLLRAGKLSALGQMSAGISHELNQPLMAITSFAENGSAFLTRGQTEKTGKNLERISDLAGRMGRIIRNLRAFARQESQPVRPVDMVHVLDAVLELSEGRIKREGVELVWQVPEAPVPVRGGEVRLQQVVMNLVSNALDAMEGRDTRRLTIALEPGEPVLLRVADTGSGIAAPDKIFDPFYSTKDVGHSEGMGLGLSISYGIIKSFGGTIRGANAPEGGAVFTVQLVAGGQEEAG
ncbi:ATP-binding protein [Tropicimonas sp. TH_r6]|uniref:sensor histidine kinase n=1 Tax=Tropicimonas sp. TH_r6 TaxID=3082085 RepID=UPI002954F976|nr:ATP-binding protein [Tropicimonas sp. TH_r6]MDV7142741.1 ATP-binding protein [Tropicimonas sp. TH_r6]